MQLYTVIDLYEVNTYIQQKLRCITLYLFTKKYKRKQIKQNFKIKK